MKSIIDEILSITYALGYQNEPIEVGRVYYSVGNTMWRYRITNLIDRHNIEYVIDGVFTDSVWYTYSGTNAPQIAKSAYFLSYNMYESYYPFL